MTFADQDATRLVRAFERLADAVDRIAETFQRFADNPTGDSMTALSRRLADEIAKPRSVPRPDLPDLRTQLDDMHEQLDQCTIDLRQLIERLERKRSAS